MSLLGDDPSVHKADATLNGNTMSPGEYRGDSVDLYVNSTCNLKCKTCFLGDEYFAQTRNIALNDAVAIFKWARQAGIEDVAFLGGEPSLHPKITDILRQAREFGISNNRIVTNGTRPFRRLITSRTRDYIDMTYVSLDGPSAQTNDVVRGHGVYKQAIETMRLLREIDIPFTITASITPTSYHELASLIEMAEASGCRTLNIHWVSPTGRARDGASSVASDDWITLCRRVMAYPAKRKGFSIQCQPAYWTPDLQALDPALRLSACAVRERTNLQFMPDGSVYACGLLTDRRGLNAYEWNGEALIKRQGMTELQICQNADKPGCPIRQKLVAEPSPESSERVPLCIYQRLHNAAN